ncbi:hypothetical protein OEA41_007540 [Lepraria neglecta]|uniref:F-box domain-containing protein n=1 Tax=Lepraria neglecta TaxID=209136 RepID=A0AAE0DNC5_9LECA|nr:hypothetical protein OEA41_007540 [Lepraria neglecta]
METQPPEVLRLIFNLLDKWTLKYCCLVCKSFEEFSSPLLFKKIVISPDRARLDLTERVVGRFSSHLTTLVVRPAIHRKLTLNEYTKEAKTLFEETKAQNCHNDKSLSAKKKRVYTTVPKFVVSLCSALSKAKNLRKVIIGEPENLYDRQGFDRDELCVGDFDDCILHGEECLPDPLSDRWPCALGLLHPAMLTLDKFGSAITEIDMEYVNDWDGVLTSLSFSAFNSSGPQARSLAHVLPRLTKLHLAFDVSSNSGMGKPCHNLVGANETCFLRGDVASALSHAIKLECLYILVTSMMDDDDLAGKGTFDAIIRGCKFPKLTSIILECLDPQGDKLEEFLLDSPKLEYLFLHNIKVISGDWVGIWDRIMLSLPLKDFMLHVIDDVNKKIMDYLLPSKDNPLT